MGITLSEVNDRYEFDVLGIGSALLDFTVEVDDSFLNDLGFLKGSMHLIDEKRSREILSVLDRFPLWITPGGSAANTLAGISRLGGRGILLGKVGGDAHGDLYIKETEKSGVTTRIGRDASITGHAITFITPDSERTFATHLGAAQHFAVNDVYEEGIARSKIIHLEGYLFEPPQLREACFHALKIARKQNVLVSVDLSDPNLIKRIHAIFKQVLGEYADIVFVNEDEARSFTGKNEENALRELGSLCGFAAVKLGSRGSIIQKGDEIFRIPAYRTEVINTNGAGDMYAAGVLFGIARGMSTEECGILGSYASSLVVSQLGARYTGFIDHTRIPMPQ